MNRKMTSYCVLLIDSDFQAYYKKLSDALSEFSIIPIPERQIACRFFFDNHAAIDVVLLEYIEAGTCDVLLDYFKSIKPSVHVVALTDNGTEELAVEAFRTGASDYFKKPIDISALRASIALMISSGSGLKPVDDRLVRGLEYMKNNCTVQLKLAEVSREAGMSRSSFERALKNRTGVTFTRYINGLRINIAMGLLGEAGRSMNDIAFACGFTNQYHFTRTFKKFAGVPPREFRKFLKR